jgi:hypothetical protein
MLAEVRALDQRKSLDGATKQKAHKRSVAAAQRRQPLIPICYPLRAFPLTLDCRLAAWPLRKRG